MLCSIYFSAICLIFSFPGDRFARTLGDDDLVLIFDGNGFIAGMQSIVPIDKALDDQFYPFSANPWYQLGDFFGQQVLKWDEILGFINFKFRIL